MIIKFRVCHNPDSSLLRYDDWIYISMVCVSPNRESICQIRIKESVIKLL